MLVKDIMLSIKFNIGDTATLSYSDAELLEAINSVVRYINTSLVNIGSTLIQKEVTLTPVDGVAQLPGDFISISSIDDELLKNTSFEIFNKNVYAKAPVKFRYYYTISKMTSKTDNIPLPDNFYELIVRFSEAFLTKSIAKDVIAKSVYEEVAKSSAGREYPYLERESPFTL